MSAKCVMVLGTTSGAGKSWLTTALCRFYARQGFKVAPFKAQNMSNNARVVADGEIGSAQYFQALAANSLPDVRMNPLLLKPERDTHSQVVLMGQVNNELSRMPWRGRSASVWPVIAQALDELRHENDVVVIEGAGSPAEINLKDSDIVNMRVALHASASCLLVTDIDRGGAFAHLYGTWAMLDDAERKLIKGFVLNKFRGDASLLAPGPQMLRDLTGVPTVATLPMWWQHGLPEEDGVFDDRTVYTNAGAVVTTIAVVAYPHISNLDEFQALKNVPGIRLKWARSPADLANVDLIILPGSKHTSGDLAWVREQGIDAAISAHAARGGAVLGICGGLQMLGESIADPQGIEGGEARLSGLHVLPIATVFDADKSVRRTEAQFGSLSGRWAVLSGVKVSGYEIHHGQTLTEANSAAAVLRDSSRNALAWQNAHGNVLGVYLHGLFEDTTVLQALFGRGGASHVPTLDSVFDGLADYTLKWQSSKSHIFL